MAKVKEKGQLVTYDSEPQIQHFSQEPSLQRG